MNRQNYFGDKKLAHKMFYICIVKKYLLKITR